MVQREPEVRPSDQMLILGKNGSGKSVLAEYLFHLCQSQKIIFNVKGDEELTRRTLARYERWAPDDPRLRPKNGKPRGDKVVSVAYGKVSELDFTKPVLIYVPASVVDVDEADRLYARLLQRRNLMIWCDECFGPTTSNRIPDHFALVLQHGRSRNLRHIGVSQRPVRIAPMLLTEAHHIVVFPRGYNARDMRTVGDEMGMDAKHLSEVVRDVTEHPWYGGYGHIHYEQRNNMLHRRQSVPAAT